MIPEIFANRIPLVFSRKYGRYYFQFQWNDRSASLEYAFEGRNIIALKGLNISSQLHSFDIGDALIERALDYAHRAGFQVIPKGEEVQRFIQRKTEYRKLVAPLQVVSASGGSM